MSACRTRTLLWAAVTAVMVTAVSGQTPAPASCGTGPSVAATVFAILLLLALAALAVVMYQYIWKPRHCSSLEKVVLAENGQPEGRYAFDNPYLVEDDDIGSKSTLPCHDILAINEKTGTSRSGDFRTPKKHGFCLINPPHHPPHQPRAQHSGDDLGEGEQVTVPLKGHDFTGLGFTVQGGMRDGIFVHTVSQHGPALESGLVQPGDRVTAVTVSFAHITLDDATAILSQSSPYDVQLHLHKSPGGHKKVTTPTGTGDRRHQKSPSDVSEGKPHRTGRQDKSPSASSPSSTGSSGGQRDRKTAVEAAVDPRKETVQHVQRDPSFREMAVDVPEHMDTPRGKKDGEAPSASSSSAKARHLGVQVLPPLMPAAGAGAGAGASGTPESRDGRRIVALGVPSLRLATRDPNEPVCGVESCLTKLANDQPVCKDLDDETGEPNMSGVDDADHKRVRMGTSSFNKQERLAKKEMDEQPDRPEPAKRQQGGDDGAIESGTKIKSRHDFVTSQESDADKDRTHDDEEENRTSRHESSLGNEDGDEVQFGRLSSEFNTLIQDDKQQAGGRNFEIKLGDSTGENDRPRSRRSSSGSDSSPVQERPKQMSFELPDEMRLAAGVAQDRRSRVDRPARSALFSSTEVLVDMHTTPSAEQPTLVSLEMQDEEQEAPEDKRVPPIAMPRSVTPDKLLSARREVTPEIDMDKDESGDEHDKSEAEVADVEPSTLPIKEHKADRPVEEEELQKAVRTNNAYQDDAPSTKMKIDKLEAFKEVLSLTPSKSPPEKRTKREEGVDVVGETVEKNHVDRCPCDGPTSTSTAPRITGEVTGLIEVGERKTPKAGPVIVGATTSRLQQAGSEERIAPPTSAAVSRARSEAGALPGVIRPVRRRDSGGPVAEVLSREAAATSGRLCASTGDLTRSTPPRPDSPLGRTVSMQIGVGDQTDRSGRVSAAACARDQMDLSRLQEGYGGGQSRLIMSVTSSNESLDTESIQEEPELEAGQSPPITINGNHHGPEDDEETAPAAVPIDALAEKEASAATPVNGLSDGEGERSRHSSEEAEDAKEDEGMSPTLPRIVRSEPKRSSESDSSDGREEPSPVTSSTLTYHVESVITAPSVIAAVLPVIHEPVNEPTTEPTAHWSGAQDTSDQSTGETTSTPESDVAIDTTPAGRSRRGPPPTPPPRSPATRQAVSPSHMREPDQFEISAVELDSVLISHEEFLRQEAERRAHVCRLAANFRNSRDPSTATE